MKQDAIEMKEFLESPDLPGTIATETARNDAEAVKLAADLTESQLNWKPAADKWSIAQCLDHLAVSSAEFNSLFTEAITRGLRKWPVKDATTYRPSMVGGWLIKQIVPENPRKVSAPKVFKPSDSSLIQGALEKFLKQEELFLGFVQQAKGLDYNKTRLRSPVTALMRYSVADAFVITVVHGRRHLAQARRVSAESNFPKSQS